MGEAGNDALRVKSTRTTPMTESFKPGETVVTNTMLVQAARLFDDPSALTSPVEAFFDFSSLVEAVVLRTQLLTLDGDLLGSNDDLAKTALPAELNHHGILRQNAVAIDELDVQRALCLIVGTERVFERLDVRGMALYVTDMLPEVFPGEQHFGRNEFAADAERFMYMMLAKHEQAGKVPSHAPSVFHFFHKEDFIDFLRGTGNQERGGYVLRTYLYSRAAWKANLAFMPDFPRVPFLESLLDELHRSVVSEGFQVLADKLKYEAEDFLTDARPLGLPLPPFTSLLLSRCNSVNDVIPELLAMRDEFESLRNNLTAFETARVSAATIKERNDARSKVESTFVAAAKKFERNGYANFKDVLDYAGDVSGPAFDWSNPGSYNSSLVTKPYEWLREWWLRRPLVQLFDVSREFRNIREYNNLVQKVFNINLSDDDIHQFDRATTHMANYFKGGKGLG